MYVLIAIAFLAAASSSALYYLKNMHMFQLNSYKAVNQFRWLTKNLIRLVPSAAFLVSFLISIFVPAAAGFTLVLLCSLLTAFFNIPGKTKKPLKYTMRVIRMIVTSSILYLLAAVLSVIIEPASFYAVISIMSALVPLIIIASNYINTPIELGLRLWYASDAKKMLRSSPGLMVIGITGSYGKTSLKYYLGALLRIRFNTLITPESYNTPMGVVKTVRSGLKATDEVFVCEMGAKYRGDIRELCELVNPRIGVLTSIGEQHLESFGSTDAIIDTKFELFDYLPYDGTFFANGDNALITERLANIEPRCRVVLYGTGENCNYRAMDVSVSSSGTEFTVAGPDGEMCRFSTKLLGSHAIINLTGAIAVANDMGIPLNELVPYVRRIAPVKHRLQLIENGNTTIIDDAYNSNPAGCRSALETLSLFKGVKILVTPGMVELGKLQGKCNMEFGVQAAAVCDYVILVGERQTGAILDGLRSAGYPDRKVFLVQNVNEALIKSNSIPTGGEKKIVLLENDLPDNY
ncbi:MAG: UDP-N-acetylmuramoyl-tripeptide--D-alanyl-D-alanine ligase [Clostridia bacterium]|nr:UDP-N-acetylmuramoyl-tripeptide--D-alanyl-D-alanine ligase [Clostridia bacterium]